MSEANSIWLIVFSVAFSLLPLLVGVCTSYLKVSIVLSLLKNGIGAQGVPGAVVSMTLALGITFYIMSPVLQQSVEQAQKADWKVLGKVPSAAELKSLVPIMQPWIDFMRKHAGERELQALSKLSQTAAASSEPAPQELSLRVLFPAFVLSELKEGFAMGFVLLLPFMAVDLIVANILAGLGMFMLSPMVISLPLKLLIFILCDGWILLGRGLISSYGV